MLIEQIIEVELRVLGFLDVHIPITGYFHDKTKIFKANLRVNDLMLKMLQKAMYLDSPDQAKSPNLTPKCDILNVFWTWPEVKEGFVQLAFKSQKFCSFK